MFFDEADALGNRGAPAQGGPAVGRGLGHRGFGAFHAAGCHGLSYLSDDTRWLLARESMLATGAEPVQTGRNPPCGWRVGRDGAWSGVMERPDVSLAGPPRGGGSGVTVRGRG